jgi:heat shock protein HslJ
MRKSFAVLAILLTVSLAACGGSDESADDPPAATPDAPAQTEGGPATSEDLDGRIFTATKAREVEITEENPLKVSFEGGKLGVDADCNRIGGNYTLEAGVIQAFLVSTAMRCPPAQAELEVFVSELLRQEAVTTLDGDELTLAGKNGTSLSLTD